MTDNAISTTAPDTLHPKIERLAVSSPDPSQSIAAGDLFERLMWNSGRVLKCRVETVPSLDCGLSLRALCA